MLSARAFLLKKLSIILKKLWKFTSKRWACLKRLGGVIPIAHFNVFPHGKTPVLSKHELFNIPKKIIRSTSHLHHNLLYLLHSSIRLEWNPEKCVRDAWKPFSSRQKQDQLWTSQLYQALTHLVDVVMHRDIKLIHAWSYQFAHILEFLFWVSSSSFWQNSRSWRFPTTMALQVMSCARIQTFFFQVDCKPHLPVSIPQLKQWERNPCSSNNHQLLDAFFTDTKSRT